MVRATHNKEKTLFLIDGSSFLYRAYYALRPLATPKGEPIQAVYGFCRMIQKLINDFQPHYLALVWDSKGQTERHKIYKAYKATRQAPPSDLFDQKKRIIEFAETIGLCQLSKEGVEADDLMFSLGQEWQKEHRGDVVVITSDKDMGQMINNHAVLYDTFKEQTIDAKTFQEKMGFPPEKCVFYFALLGDSSDNIPGVKGIGQKGALELVTQFDSLEDLYKHVDKVEKARTRTALIEHKEDAFLSNRLFLLHYYHTGITKEKLAFDSAQWARARSFFEELQFKTFLKTISHEQEQEQKSFLNPVKSSREKGYTFKTVTTRQELEAVVAAIKKHKLFAYDTEGNGISPLQLDMVGISLCYQEKESFYVPCGHEGKEEQLSRETVIEIVKPLFAHPDITKIAHHAKFDQLVLHQYGVEFKGMTFDTLIAASLVKEDWQKATLKALSAHYLDEPMLTFDQVVTDKKLPHFGHVDLKTATEYGAADAHQTFKLYHLFKAEVHKEKLDYLYYDVELPTMQTLFEMESHGIICDTHVLKELDVKVTHELAKIKKTILDLIGPEFKDINLNAPRQVEQLLFHHLKLPAVKKSKTGSYSTDNEVLVELARQHAVPGYIAQYRELAKLKSTYIEALPSYINPKTERIHTTYSQTRVATGRLASSDPNLQNIPADGLGATVRKAFVPEEGHLFLSADYSQVELRVLAHLSGDEALIRAFKAGHDIHAETAAGIFKVPLDKVTHEQRAIGKRINFSIMYGLTFYGLSKELDIPAKEAKEHIESYFKHYPKVRLWMDGVIEKATKDGYVTTWLGRRRAVPELHEKNANLVSLGKRIAVNTVAQGTAAEIMKLGMIRVWHALKKEKLDAYLVLQIHDEVLVSVAHKDLKAAEKLVKKELEAVVDWNVPFVANIRTGKNWQEA